MREELAGTAGADLNLVEHEEDALLVAQVTQALQEFLGSGTHAALALDRLGQDGADVLVHDVLDGLEVVELSIAEAGGQGLEVAVHRILAGGRAGREGAAVEGVLHRDDDEALGMAVILGYLRASLIWPSLASAPELANSTLSKQLFSTMSFAVWTAGSL